MLRVVALALGLLLSPVAAAEARAQPPAAVPGTERIARVVADRDGGPPWALRTWRARSDANGSPEAVTCVQFGRLRDGRLVRTFSGGRERELTRADRCVCAATRRRDPFAWLPQVIERLADDPANPTRLTRTVLGGVARDDVRAVDVVVRGRSGASRCRAAGRGWPFCPARSGARR